MCRVITQLFQPRLNACFNEFNEVMRIRMFSSSRKFGYTSSTGSRRSTVLLFAPFSHTLGYLWLIISLRRNCTCIVMPKFNLQEMCRNIQVHKVGWSRSTSIGSFQASLTKLTESTQRYESNVCARFGPLFCIVAWVIANISIWLYDVRLFRNWTLQFSTGLRA